MVRLLYVSKTERSAQFPCQAHARRRACNLGPAHPRTATLTGLDGGLQPWPSHAVRGCMRKHTLPVQMCNAAADGCSRARCCPWKQSSQRAVVAQQCPHCVMRRGGRVAEHANKLRLNARNALCALPRLPGTKWPSCPHGVLCLYPTAVILQGWGCDASTPTLAHTMALSDSHLACAP